VTQVIEAPQRSGVAAMPRPQLIQRLRGIVGPHHVIHQAEQLLTYETDGLTAYHQMPAVVVLPQTTDQVSQVLRFCYQNGIPFVPRGKGTGLSGGALPIEGSVVVSTECMRRILEVDLDNQRAVVEPGVINLWVTQAVSGQGYYFAPDPSSQLVCSVGGNVAENSGGVHCLKYGVTTNHVLGLEVVLPDGEVVQLGGTLEAPGYDLTGVFVGSEGTLGIATRITVRLLRKPEAARTQLAAFESIEAAGAAVSDIIAARIIPGGIELMDHLSIQAVEAATHAGYPVEAGAVMLCEVDGPRAEVAEYARRVEEICRKRGATEIRVARDDAERALLWKGRKAAFAAAGRLSPNYYVQDGVIPRTTLPEVLAEIERMSQRFGLRVANVFHAGDGNLHPLILYDEKQPGSLAKAEEFGGEILRECVRVGGSITGEHGVGHDKRGYMLDMFTPDDLDTMQMVRCAFDPKRLSNPNKVFPTPRLCGEGGGPYRPHPLEQAGVIERF
jgi:glycolate oxidase